MQKGRKKLKTYLYRVFIRIRNGAMAQKCKGDRLKVRAVAGFSVVKAYLFALKRSGSKLIKVVFQNYFF
jgi:hypothetical protein